MGSPEDNEEPETEWTHGGGYKTEWDLDHEFDPEDPDRYMTAFGRFCRRHHRGTYHVDYDEQIQKLYKFAQRPQGPMDKALRWIVIGAVVLIVSYQIYVAIISRL